ncbi:MAG: hypothetical protein PHI93_12490 [Kiritimatiellae bacterium]|nr:hypothetical protein [Kiritimatiellia bacterium]
MITYLIKKNSAAPTTLEDSGITACTLKQQANGLDSLTFTQSNDWLASPAWPYATTVALIRRITTAAVPPVVTDTCLFVGTVETIPRQAQGAGPHSITYTAFNPVFDLQICELSQEWASTSAGGAVTSAFEPTVVLGEDNNGNRLTSGQTIKYALAYAVARGINIDIGTIDDGVTVPIDERDNIKCWDAITSMLRYTPDYVLWWDYTSFTPTANLTSPASMPTVSKELIGVSAETAAFTPRYDLRVPGIQIIYRWTGEYDGRTIKRRQIDTAGNIAHPRRISLIYDLEGSRSVFISQDVEVENYPDDWTTAAGKEKLAALIPWLAQLPSGDWSVDTVNRTGTKSYPARLTGGSVPSWSGKKTEHETFTIRVSYKMKSTETGSILEDLEKDLTFAATSTNATSKTYRKQTEWIEAEPVPPNLAAALFESWNRLHYDGGVVFHEQDCSFDLAPGKLLSCTGGQAEWATMAALVQDITHDLATGTTTVKTGTCHRLEADNVIAVYRAARGRRFSYLRLGRTSGDSSNGSQIDGASTTANNSVADGTPPCLRRRLAVESKDPDEKAVLIDLDPAAITYADPANKADRTLQLREFYALYWDEINSILKAKLVQGLISDSYGDAKDVGSSSGDIDGTFVNVSNVELTATKLQGQKRTITVAGGVITDLGTDADFIIDTPEA